ncbi:MAG TPA: metallophosphoesterase [Mucilaginibacter sp.]|nr:metallophosphoesterase [Mucilaginibacter sp.]
MLRLTKPVILFFLLIAFGKASIGQGHCIIVSDMHLNPFYTSDGQHNIDTALMTTLTNADVAQWQTILNNYQKDTVSGITRGYDANYNLVRSAVNAMGNLPSKPDFIVISGDFIWHSYYNQYSQVKFKSEAQEHLLKIKTMAFIAGLIHQKFPGVQVIPALGNNDSDLGDYEFPTDTFLQAFVRDWKLNNSRARKLKVDMSSFMEGGYYKAVIGKRTFLVLNTTLLSKNTPDNNTKRDSAMFAWLKTELSGSKKNLWIVSHIPPGNDMPQERTNQLISIIKDHRKNIKFYLAAHTHFNDFRLIYDTVANGKDTAYAYVRMVASIGPNHDNSPGFIDAELGVDGSIVKENQYYLDMDTFQWESNYGVNTVGLSQVNAPGILDFMLKNPDPRATPSFYQFHSLDVINMDSYLGTTFAADMLIVN